jgi:hypothetical protein
MRLSCNLRFTEEEITILDKILHAAGFENRTDYLTALLHTTIHGETVRTADPPPATAAWIAAVRDIARTRDTVLTATLAAFDDIAFPVIAMRGGKEALAALRQEIESFVLDRCGVLPGAGDLELCMNIYQNIRRPELIRHRTDQLAAAFRRSRDDGA